MADLTPVGLSKDGKHLVLISARGEEYCVKVDHRLRAALRGDHARLGQLEMTMESTLRPRDIQARIRAGESAEDLAAAAQTTVEKVMVFAGPVLDERAHVARSAQACSVRRRSGESGAAGARTLQEAAVPQLRVLGLREDDVAWDAWRRDDGRWTLVADYTVDGDARHAEFGYDVRGRYVTPENDEARVLTGDLPPAAPAAAAPAGARRLSAVPAQDELPLGDDAIELVREQAGDLGRLTATGDADWIAEVPAERRPVDGAAPVDEPTDPDAPTPPPADEAGETSPAGPASTDSADSPDSPDSSEPTVEVDTGEHGRGRRKGRASVPSWDEIMFGGGGKRE